MRNQTLMIALLTLIPHTPSLAGERELGSGGNDAVAEFLEIARSIRDDLRAHPTASTQVSSDQLELVISDAPVLGKNCETQRCVAPFVGTNGRRLVTDSIACNFSLRRQGQSFRRIEVCNQGWRAAALETRRLIVLHEYVPLITGTLDYNYELSRTILERIEALKEQQARRVREERLRSEQEVLERAARAQAERDEAERVRRQEQELLVRERVRQERAAREAARLAAEADGDTFPLIGEADDENVRREGTVVRELALGAGGGVQRSQRGANSSPRINGLGSLRLDANYMRGDNDSSVGPSEFSLAMSLRTLLGASANQPVYQVRGDISGGFLAVISLWVAMEVNQFEDMREEIIRTMGNPVHVNLKKNGKDYMLIRVGIGPSMRRDNRAPVGSDYVSSPQISRGLSAAMTLLGRFGSFFVELDAEYDQPLRQWSCSGDEETEASCGKGLSARVSAELELGRILNFIFPNDEIRIRGRMVRYTDGSRLNEEGSSMSLPQVTEMSAGVYYQARFGN